MMNLKFTNRHAPKGKQDTHIVCDRDSAPLIMTWYGAYNAGDDYSVFMGDTLIPIDQNGAPISWFK